MNNNTSLINTLLYRINELIIYAWFRIKKNPQYLCKRWVELIREDSLKKNGVSPSKKRYAYRRGFLSYAVKNYDLSASNYRQVVSDFRKLWIKPYNNSFGKWFLDNLTPYLILTPYHDNMLKLYAFVERRHDVLHVLPKKDLDIDLDSTSIDQLLTIADAKGDIILTPLWRSVVKVGVYKKLIRIIALGDGQYNINGEVMTRKEAVDTLLLLDDRYVVQENYVNTKSVESTKVTGTVSISQVNVFVGTKYLSSGKADSKILNAEIALDVNGKMKMVAVSNLAAGKFKKKGRVYAIPEWDSIRSLSTDIADYCSELNYIEMSFGYREDGSIVMTNITSNPKEVLASMPRKMHDEFIRHIYTNKKNELKLLDKKELERKRIENNKLYEEKNKLIKQGKLLPGIRTYMYGLWKASVESDKETTGYTDEQKQWAWDRGFLSYRIKQYGLTEENYTDFLSDLDYHWLNRINNFSLKWINDKTTFRYTFDPFKEHLPEYYFLIFGQGGKKYVKVLQDADEGTDNSYEAILEYLRKKGILVFKPSSGTHGDGFYKLEYIDNQYYINAEPATASELYELFDSQKSYYVVTDYIYMNKDLGSIYPKSLNTVRIMVINEGCVSPKIKQAYMRIGSAKTGFTDNVGYGGICAMVDIESGQLYNAESITNHEFIPCPIHPDTGVNIEEKAIPHWNEIKEELLEICKYYGELEYWGFDIAVTEDSFKIIEANIHQDLHKVASYDDELRAYFKRKIAQKKEVYNIQ